MWSTSRNSNKQVYNLLSSSKGNTMVKKKLSFFLILKCNFSNNLQNLWVKHCSSKTVDSNMSRMYYTKVNFPTYWVVFRHWCFTFFFFVKTWNLALWNIEIYRFSKILNSDTNWIFPIKFCIYSWDMHSWKNNSAVSRSSYVVNKKFSWRMYLLFSKLKLLIWNLKK